jgi:hypothetical protein
MSSEQVALGGFTVSVVALIFLAWQLVLLRVQIKQAKDAFVTEQARVRRQSTLEFIATTLERRQALGRDVPSELDKTAVAKFLEEAKADRRVHRRLDDYLNYFEMVATGVNNEIFDIDVIDRASGTIIVRVEETYRDFVRDVREREAAPTIWKETQALATAIRARRDENSARKP